MEPDTASVRIVDRNRQNVIEIDQQARQHNEVALEPVGPIEGRRNCQRDKKVKRYVENGDRFFDMQLTLNAKLTGGIRLNDLLCGSWISSSSDDRFRHKTAQPNL